tara:strand:+ start:1445 stop:1867 length:423 start_codon:yes stop_codon:yes gene_type:complete
MNKKVITIEQYIDCVKTIKQKYKGLKVNIITNWRGGAPLAIHLNNIMEDSTLTLLKYQTYDKSDAAVEFLTDDWEEGYDVTLFVDDIYDTGKSSYQCQLAVKQRYGIDCEEYYIVSKDVTPVSFIYDMTERWIVFPWETI